MKASEIWKAEHDPKPARRHWLMYCLINKRGDHNGSDKEIAKIRSELDDLGAAVGVPR